MSYEPVDREDCYSAYFDSCKNFECKDYRLCSVQAMSEGETK